MISAEEQPKSKMCTRSPISAEKRGASPETLADQEPSPKRRESSVSVAAGMPDLTSLTGLVDSAVCGSDVFAQSIIDEIIDTGRLEDFADEVLQDEELVQILEEFLGTLSDNSQQTLSNRALEHFDKVKNIWRNRRFISLLLQSGGPPCSMKGYMNVSLWELTKFLVPKIKKDLQSEYFFEDTGVANMMRLALSILIGYWSNEDLILPLLVAMGCRALGVKHIDFEDACFSVVKEEKTSLASGEARSGNNLCTESSAPIAYYEESANGGMPVCSLIMDLFQDPSIKKLADQLVKIPDAVKVASKVVIFRDDRNYSNAIRFFWRHSEIRVTLIKALRESIPLVNLLKRYSKGAQRLRCEDRMIRIQEDPWLGSILVSDRVTKIRGALSILFGYWMDADVSVLLMCLYPFQARSQKFAGVELLKENVHVIHYFAVGFGDVEGLKNALADKYCEDSVEYMDLFEKVKMCQEAKEQNAMKLGYAGHGARMAAVLKDGDMISFYVHWYFSDSGVEELYDDV